MRGSHLAMFNRAFKRFYREATEAGLNDDQAETWAADRAWIEYEQYCDDKLHELKEDGHERF